MPDLYPEWWPGNDVAPGGLWWWQTLSTNRYLPSQAVSNAVWRFPAVRDKDVSVVFGARWEGYRDLKYDKNDVFGSEDLLFK